jgi:hypothetical protein
MLCHAFQKANKRGPTKVQCAGTALAVEGRELSLSQLSRQAHELGGTTMKRLLAALPVLVSLNVTTTEAQIVMRRGAVPASRLFAGAGGYSPITIAGPSAGYVSPYPGYYMPPYSYYAAPYPWLARQYVGYGNDGFPFYGRPYGSPSDRWSWAYLSGWTYHTDPILW